MSEIIKRKLNGVKENVILAPYTTFKIGGEAEYFLEVERKEELIKAIELSKEINLPVFILGRGSNLLVSDEGFKGLVLKIDFNEIEIEENSVICGAGVSLSELLKRLTEEGLSGLEWAAGIPGTVGGAIRGNAGAFEGSMSDCIREIEALEINPEIRIKKYNKEESKFNYRSSIFKNKKDIVIINALFELEKGNREKIKKDIEKYLNYRKEKHPLSFPSAGSIFKNPVDNSAANLIDKSGLKGEQIGGAKVSEKHANFIVNSGEAKAEDVLELIALVKKRVKKKFGIELEEEIELVGF
jgi:UDP-N-acetylmuramate dehydrogenase